MRLSVLAASALLAHASYAQSPAALPAFEAASVKRSDPKATGLPPNDCHGGPQTSDPGRLTCTNAALSLLVTMAYDLKFYQLVSPEWMIHGGSQSGYDVAAKVPPGATKEQFRLMLQQLVAERFHLAVHRETKDLPRFALLPGKGALRIKPSSAPPPPGPRFAMTVVNGHLRLSFHNSTLASLAGILVATLSAPVTDETGLPGEYDFTLEFMPDDRWRGFSSLPPAPGATSADAAPNLFLAVQDQLGLKLESGKAPLEVWIVDRADKVPVEH